MATRARLTPRQRRSLKQDGYLLVPSVLGGDDLARITARPAEHVHQTVATWAKDPVLAGGWHLTNLQLRAPWQPGG